MPVINPTPSVPAPSAAGPAPCAWTLDVSCCDGWADFSNTTRDRATSWATGILWALTGRRFGTCEIMVRPCGATCQYYGGWMAYPAIADGVGTVWTPFIRDGVWFNCACSGVCTCQARCRVWLPGPAASVTEVVVDGIVIDPSMYRVDDRQFLVGINGQCWPDCQNMNLESPEVGTFEVTYNRGTALPKAGEIAAGIMACEFAKACESGPCALPANLTSLARQGIEVTAINPTDVLDAGLTGIPEVDLWIRSVNPDRKTHRPRVYSPDLHFPTMRTS